MTLATRALIYQLVLVVTVSVVASLLGVWLLSLLLGFAFKPALVAGVSGAVSAATVLQSSRRARVKPR